MEPLNCWVRAHSRELVSELNSQYVQRVGEMVDVGETHIFDVRRVPRMETVQRLESVM